MINTGCIIYKSRYRNTVDTCGQFHLHCLNNGAVQMTDPYKYVLLALQLYMNIQVIGTWVGRCKNSLITFRIPTNSYNTTINKMSIQIHLLQAIIDGATQLIDII